MCPSEAHGGREGLGKVQRASWEARARLRDAKWAGAEAEAGGPSGGPSTGGGTRERRLKEGRAAAELGSRASRWCHEVHAGEPS